ncbi:MAG: hypothetical protein KBT46_08310, partial [Ruminococcus sp.]|nr:hypothetical protein [Candidatus Copronaster equi]
MKKITRFISLLIVAAMLFSFSSCKVKESIISSISDINSKDNNPGIDKIAYSIPFVRTDSLDPYKAETNLNTDLSTLLYDSLYAVDNNFKPVALIAQASTLSDNVLTVTIKAGLKFSDDTILSADDVIYSFNKAKDSANYSAYLDNITDARGTKNTIMFTLKHYNQYEEGNLVFPIIKANSDVPTDRYDDSGDYDEDEEKTQNETYGVVPVGSGRYYIDEAEEGDGKILRANKNRLGSYHPVYNMIGLTDVIEATSLNNLFNLSEIDFYTNDFKDGEYVNYTGIGTNRKTTNFVYLGVNDSTESLSDGDVRRAIALAINRTDLASVSFTGCAQATSTPFHTKFFALKDCTLPAIKYDSKAAVKLLEGAGFNSVSKLGIRSSESSSLELSLLVNKSNNFKVSMARSIQQALSKVEIKVNINELEYESYVEAVKEKNYDLYIGEAKLSNSFDLGRFFTEDGGLDFGIDTKSDTAKKYIDYRDGKITLQQFMDSFSDELPIIPIAFRDNLCV